MIRFSRSDRRNCRRMDRAVLEVESLPETEYRQHLSFHVDGAQHECGRTGQGSDLHGAHDALYGGERQGIPVALQREHDPAGLRFGGGIHTARRAG